MSSSVCALLSLDCLLSPSLFTSFSTVIENHVDCAASLSTGGVSNKKIKSRGIFARLTNANVSSHLIDANRFVCALIWCILVECVRWCWNLLARNRTYADPELLQREFFFLRVHVHATKWFYIVWACRHVFKRALVQIVSPHFDRNCILMTKRNNLLPNIH